MVGLAVTAGLVVAAMTLINPLARGGGRTAFATAAEGEYAIVIEAGQTIDSLVAVPLDDPSARFAIADVPHVPGFTSLGATSPAGGTVAVLSASAGSRTDPTATLRFVDLESGGTVERMGGLDRLQPPIWRPDGSGVVVVRNETAGPLSNATVIEVRPDGTASDLFRVEGVAGVFPFAVTDDGAVWSAVIGSAGTTLFRNETPRRTLSAGLTRDWSLSPDGGSVAFIDVVADEGIRYVPRQVSIAAGAVAASSLVAVDGGEALGSAWAPGSAVPTFGLEPGGGVAAASLTASGAGGFDVPLAFAPSGHALAVQHWDGRDFGAPGKMVIALRTDAGLLALPNATRFAGWVSR